MRRLTAPLTALAFAALLALAPAAQAAWFGADVVDGPAEIDALGDVDVARDGSGGARLPQARRRRAAGLPLAPATRASGSRRRSSPTARPVSEAAVTATDGGRLAAAWVAGGEVLGRR